MSEKPSRMSPIPHDLEQPRSLATLLFGLLRGVGGAVMGGALGFYGFEWITTMGFYSLVLPGALLGLGFGLAAQQRNVAFGIICALAALALGLFAEWHNFPFKVDDSFSYFVTHLNQLKPITWIMLVIGALMAFWFGRGR